jgi:hypothetical protein
LPADNENVPASFATTDEPLEPALSPFAPDQLVRCEECLRANPPTRVNCLYCAALLPQNEATVDLQKPALRPLEKWQQGFNTILLPPVANLTPEKIAAAADLLRLRTDDLSRILFSPLPLPLARAATLDEATLIQRRLKNLEINSHIMPEADLGIDSEGPIKVRSLDLDDDHLFAYQSPDAPAIAVAWADLVLLVSGRLIFKRMELTEQKGARADSIIDASEFFSDEAVVDIYVREEPRCYRVAANSFDFSCLGGNKGLLATENIVRLVQLLRERSPHVEHDDSFASVRKSLEAVWPSETQNASSGWRRERPGKYSIGTVTGLSNEMQFLRYSRLRYFLRQLAAGPAPGSDEGGENG